MGAEIAAIARRWVGTPYQHQASCEAVGADCLGLVRGIWREACGPEPQSLPTYTPDWLEPAGDEYLLEALKRHFVEHHDVAEIGDVLAFRMKFNGVTKHLAIKSASNRIIHAYTGRGVVETMLSPTWERRITGVFRFPDRRK